MDEARPSKLPPINAIRVFEAAARLGSFTRAGAELGMTQAAVSYQIKLLEERLGFALFRREARQVVLTPNGRRLSASASEAFRVLEAAFASANASAANVLTITTWSTFSANWLVPRLGAFQVAHPELAVRVDTSHRMVDLTREDVDVAIRSGQGEWPGLESRFLFEDVLTALVPARAAARLKSLSHPRDLLALRLIGPIDWWTEWFARSGVPASELPERTALELETQYMEVSAALAAGDAAVIVSPRYFERELASGALLRPFPEHLEGQRIWAVHDKARSRSPKIRAFLRWLCAQTEQGGAEPASNRRARGLSTPS
jgi:LysR family glycine cleavage system transcriptional activator